jgi:hypothetical protein
MPWAKLDDRFHDNPKIRRAWMACPASVGVHVMALTYSAAHSLNGHVEPEFVQTLLPGAKARREVVTALVTAGLWLVCDPGWEIKDYLKYNPSREQVEAKRAKAAAAGKLGGMAKAALAGGVANA